MRARYRSLHLKPSLPPLLHWGQNSRGKEARRDRVEVDPGATPHSQLRQRQQAVGLESEKSEKEDGGAYDAAVTLETTKHSSLLGGLTVVTQPSMVFSVLLKSLLGLSKRYKSLAHCKYCTCATSSIVRRFSESSLILYVISKGIAVSSHVIQYVEYQDISLQVSRVTISTLCSQLNCRIASWFLDLFLI